MATMTILEAPACQGPDCDARATRSVQKHSGEVDSVLCSRHGNARLVELAKEEGQYAAPKGLAKAVKS